MKPSRSPLATAATLVLCLSVFILAADPPGSPDDDLRLSSRTMVDLRAMAMTLEAYHVDHGFFPLAADSATLAEIVEPVYIRELPRKDGWGNFFSVSSAASGYTIGSGGKDGGAPHVIGAGGALDDVNNPIVLIDGEFVQWHAGTDEEPRMRAPPATPADTREPSSDPAGASDPLMAGVGNVSNPVRLHHVSPRYPDLLRRQRIVGTVILQCVVRRDGSVDDIAALKANAFKLKGKKKKTKREPIDNEASAMLFSMSAIEAVRQWRYEPATQNGEPVDAYFTVVVDFDLQ